jgi:hypothetical protein
MKLKGISFYLLTILLVSIIMVNSGVEAFGIAEKALLHLVPSQVLIQNPAKYRTTSMHQSSQTSLTETAEQAINCLKSESHNGNSNRKKKKRQRKKKRQANTEKLAIDEPTPKADATSATESNVTYQHKTISITAGPVAVDSVTSSYNLIYPKSGDLPDVYWRSISMEHLRLHPRFQTLPPPHEIARLDCLEDARLFRQDSWQWDALHHGRCTTSQAVAALGFLEPITGEVLGISNDWLRGGTGAYVRLGQKAIRSLDDMNKVLCDHGDDALVEGQGCEHQQLWEKRSATGNKQGAFEFQYLYQTPESEFKRRKIAVQRLFQNQVSIKTIRMAWGNAQEATSLLTALNYFSERDPGFVMKETGMCGAGLDLNQTLSSVLIGATPDAILCHSDGSIEALEVKNHCPFAVPRVAKGKRRHDHRFIVGDFPFDEKVKVFSHYIPQLMMEMFCLGPECRSIVLVRQTATNGALLLRLHRDDEWIDDMLHFLQRFQSEFVDKEKPPARNFFWTDQDTNKNEIARYRRFVNKTLEIRNKIDIIAHIPHDKVQRVASGAPLFLD